MVLTGFGHLKQGEISMSYFLFGDFSSNLFIEENINNLKSVAQEKGICFWFNEEIDFDEDIHRMLNEHPKSQNNIRLCVTTQYQPCNSEDLLLPWGDYDTEVLFPNGGDDRKEFNNICKRHLSVFEEIYYKFLLILKPQNLRIFITEGYDCEFITCRCENEYMFKDLEQQIIERCDMDSKIYEIEFSNHAHESQRIRL
jgi:hypothetical protein